MAVIQARQLTKVYGDGPTQVTALDRVDLSVNPGEFVAGMGPSGGGKSTLLHLLRGQGPPPAQLAAGQQQRVAISRALVAEPALVLADEPTGNLDSRASDEIAALLRQVANEGGRAVIMVTHH